VQARAKPASGLDHLSLEQVVPLAGLGEALERGIGVLDIGCGQGHAVNLLARAFPRNRICGYDFSESGIAAAHAEARALGNMNVDFVGRDIAVLHEPNRSDLITAFIRDQTLLGKANMRPGL
jgi:trans-aconitate methyltransferase